MQSVGTFGMSDYGLRTDDVKYFHIDSRIQGRGPNRLKHLDVEGRWVLSGSSMPYISAAFNHLERINDAQSAFRDITEEPLNAIGMVGWTPSERPVEEVKKVEKKPAKFILPPVVAIEDEVPPSPREIVPHRSAGYGQAHQKRKLSIPDRSRSTSPAGRSATPDYDRLAKFERHRKESITSYGTRWGEGRDIGYESASTPSPRPADCNEWVLPHRTQPLSRPGSRTGHAPSDSAYYHPESFTSAGDRASRELYVKTRETGKSAVPYRSGGYGVASQKRQYELSPRSIGSAGDLSDGSEMGSPNYRNADEVLMMAYHSKKSAASPRQHSDNWVRH